MRYCWRCYVIRSRNLVWLMTDAEGDRKHDDKKHCRGDPPPSGIHGARIRIERWIAPQRIVRISIIVISKVRHRSASFNDYFEINNRRRRVVVPDSFQRNGT